MPACSLDQTEAVQRYYAAFPALKKGRQSPLLYYLPPPAWCRKSPVDTKTKKMQSEISMSKDWNYKNKKSSSGKERRNSYHSQKKNKKRSNSYSRSFDSKDSLPEWVTYEGVWDMETQNSVKEFIRAIAVDEGYGTCENTVTDEIKEITRIKDRMKENMLSNWDDSLNLETEWVITEDLNPRIRTPMEEELYAKFEAKFDRSIEALWSKDQNTPDDEYQDLPIDFQDLLSSPSDHLFADPCAEKYSLISLTESIWSNDAADGHALERSESPTKLAEGLHDRFRPLNLTDVAEPVAPQPREIETFALYEGEEIYDALSCVANMMRSFTAINHSRERSGFVEVPPRRSGLASSRAPPPPEQSDVSRKSATRDRDDLLTSAHTHFRPIRRESENEARRYNDGDTFRIRGDLEPVDYRRSDSGSLYLSGTLDRYLEYRAVRTIDYGRLQLTAAQRCPDLDELGLRLRFPVRQVDVGVQTDRSEPCDECPRAKKMRAAGLEAIWSESEPPRTPASAAPLADELSREWEELLSDISAAHAQYAGGGEADETPAPVVDRKRRHSAALRCAPACTHPHARFLQCCTLALAADRPLTR